MQMCATLSGQINTSESHVKDYMAQQHGELTSHIASLSQRVTNIEDDIVSCKINTTKAIDKAHTADSKVDDLQLHMMQLRKEETRLYIVGQGIVGLYKSEGAEQIRQLIYDWERAYSQQ